MRMSNALMAGLLIGAVIAPAAAPATPNVTGAVVLTRVFDDCPGSGLTVVNNYPFEIRIADVGANCYGWANLHLWRYAVGGSPAAFPNASAFKISANLVVSGSGQGEAGLQIAPWWSEADGRLNVRTTDGEVACFGGRLPFYSFTAQHGVRYEKGRTINLTMIYLPHDLNAVNPATVIYSLFYNGRSYTSGPLAFDMGNPAENPPYGLWGMLNQGKVGGFVQPLWAAGGDPAATVTARFTDICFENFDLVPTEEASWGGVKSLYR